MRGAITAAVLGVLCAAVVACTSHPRSEPSTTKDRLLRVAQRAAEQSQTDLVHAVAVRTTARSAPQVFPADYHRRFPHRPFWLLQLTGDSAFACECTLFRGTRHNPGVYMLLVVRPGTSSIGPTAVVTDPGDLTTLGNTLTLTS